MSAEVLDSLTIMEVYDIVHDEFKRLGKEEKFLKEIGSRTEYMKKIGLEAQA